MSYLYLYENNGMGYYVCIYTYIYGKYNAYFYILEFISN